VIVLTCTDRSIQRPCTRNSLPIIQGTIPPGVVPNNTDPWADHDHCIWNFHEFDPSTIVEAAFVGGHHHETHYVVVLGVV
jgi:hypothetical protein